MIPTRNLELRSLVTEAGELRLELLEADVPAPKEDEVLVQVEASPLNPSDQGYMLASADLSTGRLAGSSGRPIFTARIPPERMRALRPRIGIPLPVGNEGAGLVLAAGASPEAQALMARKVAVFGGGLYAKYRCVKVAQCIPLPAETPVGAAASCFINPLTALGMVETLRLEGHSALVHTAAASSLGQMLLRICHEDGIPLVAVVRSSDQESLLRSQGASHVCNMNAPEFIDSLTDAIAATGATLAFDAIGGGTVAGQILASMEAAIARGALEYSPYGSSVHKQVYIYGSLDTGPTVLQRTFGLTWGVGGWLLWPFLKRIGTQRTSELKERVVAGLDSTFKSHYKGQLSLADLLQPEIIAQYTRRSTGSKYVVTPGMGPLT